MKSTFAHRSPYLSVDVIIETTPQHIVLIERANPPFGWALPGGYVDYGETAEDAAIREAQEETSLEIQLRDQFYTYSLPIRDNNHTITTVFLAQATGNPQANDDAKTVKIFHIAHLPPLIPDHQIILRDYLRWKERGLRPFVGLDDIREAPQRAVA